MQLLYVTLSFTLVVLVGLLLFHIYQSRLLSRTLDNKLQDFQQNVLRSDMMGFYREMESYASMMESKVEEYRGLVHRMEEGLRKQQDAAKETETEKILPAVKSSTRKTSSASKKVSNKSTTVKSSVAEKTKRTTTSVKARKEETKPETKQTVKEKKTATAATKKKSPAKSTTKVSSTKQEDDSKENVVSKKVAAKPAEKKLSKAKTEQVPSKDDAESTVKKNSRSSAKTTAAKTSSKKTAQKTAKKTAKKTETQSDENQNVLPEKSSVKAPVKSPIKPPVKSIETKRAKTVAVKEEQENNLFTENNMKEESEIVIQPQKKTSAPASSQTNRQTNPKEKNEILQTASTQKKSRKPQTELQRKSDRLLQMIADSNSETDTEGDNEENAIEDFIEEELSNDMYFSSKKEKENTLKENEEIKNLLWSDWREQETLQKNREKIVEGKQIEAVKAETYLPKNSPETPQQEKDISSAKNQKDKNEKRKGGTLINLMRGVGKAVKPMLGGKNENVVSNAISNEENKTQNPTVELPAKPTEGDFSGLLAKEMGINNSLYGIDYNTEVALPDYFADKEKEETQKQEKKLPLTKRQQALEDAKDAFLPPQTNTTLDYRETRTYKMLEDMSSHKEESYPVQKVEQDFSESEKLKQFAENSFLSRETSTENDNSLIEKKVSPTEFSLLIKNLQEGQQRADSLRQLMNSGFNLNEIENLSGVSYSELSLIRSLYNL